MRNTVCLSVALIAAVFARPAAAQDLAPDRGAFDTAVHRVGDIRSVRFDPAACRSCYAPARRKDWRFFVAPYAWLASVEGDVVSGGESADLDIPFSDLAEATNGGFQLYVEARWRRFFIAFDGTWASLTPFADQVGRLLDVKVDIEQRLFDCRVGYEVYRKSLDGCLDPCCEGWRRWIVADVFVGARYWYTKTTLSVEGRGPIGIEAQFAWQISGGVSYKLSGWAHLFLGYRVLAFDTVSGSGAERDGADLVQHGPLLGLGFSF